jgi:predicted amidohydrolase
MNRDNEVNLRLIQINYKSDNIQDHLSRIKAIILEHRRADLIVFPELILHGHPSVEKPEGFLYRKMKVYYRSVSDELYLFVKKTGARVIIGELKRRGDKYYNLATYVDRDSVQRYVKTHVHWTENFTPGKELKVFETPIGKVGVNICFDAAFSEVWRALTLAGAEIIVNISAVPETFPVTFMWRRMQGAAIFNQLPVVYANRPGAYFSGFSAVFDPMGRPLVHAGKNEEIRHAGIDMSVTRTWREDEAIFPHRRPQLYRNIVSHPPGEPTLSTRLLKAAAQGS